MALVRLPLCAYRVSHLGSSSEKGLRTGLCSDSERSDPQPIVGSRLRTAELETTVVQQPISNRHFNEEICKISMG